jgi:hypothetical protein
LEKINISTAQLEEASKLSEEILKNIELSELPLSSIALRLARLSRILGLTEYRKLFEYEVSGYPSTPTGVPREAWGLAQLAGRGFKEKRKEEGKKREKIGEYIYIESIDTLEEQIRSSTSSLNVTKDPDISLATSNPHQYLSTPIGNQIERTRLRADISKATKRLSERKSFMYKFALNKYLELKFSNQVYDFFSSVRHIVDTNLSKLLPEATEKLSSIIDNLKSEKSEDWSNAVHSCRRLLQTIADKLFPPEDTPREKNKKLIQLGSEKYINRLICYVEDNCNSDVFEQVVGSNLAFLGDRLDAIFNASQKGSHNIIRERSEAERYVVYTYMTIGDILQIVPKVSPSDEKIAAGKSLTVQ